MRRFSGHLKDRWGSFVDVKVNLLDVLDKELPRKPGGTVWLSSVCDPYQPLEHKYQLTRRVIEAMSRYSQFPISVLTKNDLVLRDLDLLERLKDRVDVGFTITTFNSEAQPIFEPYASSVNDRIKALGKLNEAGIDTWAFIAPILPDATESDLETGFLKAKSQHARQTHSHVLTHGIGCASGMCYLSGSRQFPRNLHNSVYCEFSRSVMSYCSGIASCAPHCSQR
jgi:DNA repair photolyase